MFFAFEGYEVYSESPVRIIVKEDNTPLFCGLDIAKILGCKTPQIEIQNNCPNREIISFYPSRYGRMTKLAFIPREDVLRLIKNKVSNPEDFITDILNGIMPKIENGKASANFAVINLDCEETFITQNGIKYQITVKKV